MAVSFRVISGLFLGIRVVSVGVIWVGVCCVCVGECVRVRADLGAGREVGACGDSIRDKLENTYVYIRIL